MKKKLLLSLLTLCLLNSIYSQQTYYDALKLRSYILVGQNQFTNDNPTRQSIATILRNYSSNPVRTNSASTIATVMHEFDNNLFIKPYMPGGFYAGGTAGIANLITSIGNLDVTAFADGLAKFLVERTKEELDEAFFKKFADFLNYYPEFKTLFPNTNVFVNSFNSWEYSNLLNTLREAFDKDIKELLSNFIKLRNLTSKDCPDKKTNNTSLCDDCVKRLNSLNDFFKSNGGLFLLSAAQIGNGILQNQKVPDIINSITNTDFLLGYTDPGRLQVVNDLKNSLQLLNIFSLSLKSNETGRHYITETEFKLLEETDPILQQLYFGLLYQQIANENNGAGIKINGTDVISVFTPTTIDGAKNYLTNLFNQSKNLQTVYNNLLTHKLDGKSDLSTDYATIFETANQLLHAATATNIINSNLQCPKELNDAFALASKTLQISHDIAVRNYNAAVIGTLKFISDQSQDYNSTHNDSHISEFSSAFLKYGSFASNVVLSKSPDDIKEAIKSFVLPSGSSSMKKHTSFSISLNSYVGFVYGINNNPQKSSFTTKTVDGTKDSTVKLNGGSSLSVYAPVGIGLNFGLGWRRKNPWSVSAFISIIDIGALVGYRFSDTSQISNTFKVSAANIFAPGGNIIIGLPNMPISIGGGLQWIPTLQRDPASNTLYNVDHSAIRYQVFVAVDIPMLNFHSSKNSLLNVKSK